MYLCIISISKKLIEYQNLLLLIMRVLLNYFDSSTKFSNLAQFLDMYFSKTSLSVRYIDFKRNICISIFLQF